ncbi:MAG TPA: metalloregulator ArsR/SmtB family transcription factor [Candidatus Acidoferrales bacterium]|jgi:ArsR family transcriptional regulator|nr:metalloregulator ArsR/SmtB family transcription factor [Candidatus Acidoferrales bacterium]
MNLAAQAEGVLEQQLRALADPTRRHIIELLKRRGCCSCDEVGAQDPGLCICDLESALPLSQPTITHHIRVLREAGLITTWKIGRWVYCRRKEDALDRLGEWLRKL